MPISGKTDDHSPRRPALTPTPAASDAPWCKLPRDLQPSTAAEWRDWRWQLANRVRDPASLANLMGFDAVQTDALRHVVRRYPAAVTPYYLSVARHWSTSDPIVRQFLPDAQELEAGDLPADGLGESLCSPFPGLFHRYRNRVLVIASQSCAVLCRHCFRKRLWKPGETDFSVFAKAAAYVAADERIREVILSGGDALLCPADRLTDLIATFGAIGHVSAVRVASRLPVVLPQRITPSLCRRLAAQRPLWFMTQFNHPLELTVEAKAACRNLLSHGIQVMNQTVLLKGINDDPRVLGELFDGLVGIGVKPYYLLHGDPVAGTAHFRTGVECGLRIMAALRGELSGLATPAFAIDLPDGGGKVVLEPNRQVAVSPAGKPVFHTFDGRDVEYV